MMYFPSILRSVRVAYQAEGGGGGAGGDGGGAGGGAGGGGGGGAGGGAAGGGAGGGDGGGEFKGAWYDNPALGFGDDFAEVKEHIAGKGFADLKTALKSGMEADRMARDRNVMPKPDPKKLPDWEGWEALGWVKDPAKYTPKKPELKTGQVFDETSFNDFAKKAHELRIPLPAAEALFHDQFEKFQARIGDHKRAQEDENKKLQEALQTTLRGEWKDDYDAKSDQAKRAMQALDVGKDDAGELEKFMGAPRMVKFFQKIGEMLGEDKLVGGGGGGGGALPESLSAARSELNRLQGDRDFMAAFRDPRNPRHRDVIRERQAVIDKIAALEAKERQQQGTG